MRQRLLSEKLSFAKSARQVFAASFKVVSLLFGLLHVKVIWMKEYFYFIWATDKDKMARKKVSTIDQNN